MDPATRSGGASIEPVPERLVDGLADGLILRAVEREPANAATLAQRLSAKVEHEAPYEVVPRVVDDLEADDHVRTDDADGVDVYHLTQRGARRLAAYRSLPAGFRASIEDLLALDAGTSSASGLAHTSPGEPLDASKRPAGADANAPSRATAHPLALGGAGSRKGWVEQALAALPSKAQVQAPYAQVSMDLDTAANRWTLSVERHDPGAYEGAGACPLTFLYLAATRLLYGRTPASRPAAGQPAYG